MTLHPSRQCYSALLCICKTNMRACCAHELFWLPRIPRFNIAAVRQNFVLIHGLEDRLAFTCSHEEHETNLCEYRRMVTSKLNPKILDFASEIYQRYHGQKSPNLKWLFITLASCSTATIRPSGSLHVHPFPFRGSHARGARRRSSWRIPSYAVLQCRKGRAEWGAPLNRAADRLRVDPQ